MFFFLLTHFNGGSAVYVTLGVGWGKGTQVIIPTLNVIFKKWNRGTWVAQ